MRQYSFPIALTGIQSIWVFVLKDFHPLVKSASRTDISLVKRFGLFSFRSSSCGFSPCLAPQQLYHGPPACGIVKKALETLDTVRWSDFFLRKRFTEHDPQVTSEKIFFCSNQSQTHHSCLNEFWAIKSSLVPNLWPYRTSKLSFVVAWLWGIKSFHALNL